MILTAVLFPLESFVKHGSSLVIHLCQGFSLQLQIPLKWSSTLLVQGYLLPAVLGDAPRQSSFSEPDLTSSSPLSQILLTVRLLAQSTHWQNLRKHLFSRFWSSLHHGEGISDVQSPLLTWVKVFMPTYLSPMMHCSSLKHLKLWQYKCITKVFILTDNKVYVQPSSPFTFNFVLIKQTSPSSALPCLYTLSNIIPCSESDDPRTLR